MLAEIFLKALPNIQRTAQDHEPPFVAKISRSALREQSETADLKHQPGGFVFNLAALSSQISAAPAGCLCRKRVYATIVDSGDLRQAIDYLADFVDVERFVDHRVHLEFLVTAPVFVG